MTMPTSTSAYADAYAPNRAYGQPAQPMQQEYQTAQHQAAPERSYTLGGGAYDSGSTLSAQNPYQDDAHYARYSDSSHMPSPYSPLPTPSFSHVDTAAPAALNTSAVSGTSTSPTSPRGPRSPKGASVQSQSVYEDQPPVYDVATAQPPGQYDSKR
jgi:hypothetical protein